MIQESINYHTSEIEHKKKLVLYLHNICNDIAEHFGEYSKDVTSLQKYLTQAERDVTLYSVVFDAAETVISNTIDLIQTAIGCESIESIETVDDGYAGNNTGIVIQDSINIVPRKETKK